MIRWQRKRLVQRRRDLHFGACDGAFATGRLVRNRIDPTDDGVGGAECAGQDAGVKAHTAHSAVSRIKCHVGWRIHSRGHMT